MRHLISRIIKPCHPSTVFRTRQASWINSGFDATPIPLQWIPQRRLLFKLHRPPDNKSESLLSPGEETPESKLFKMGSSLASRLSTDRKIQCTEIDSRGEIVVNHKEIKRSDLVSKVSNLTLVKQRTGG
jgi:hypothetical protein